jgi:hypothetical protein
MRNFGRLFLMTVAALPAWAGGLDDPFATDQHLPLKPSPRLMARARRRVPPRCRPAR